MTRIMPGRATKGRPKFIYYTEITKDGEFVESRLSFHPAQYWLLSTRRIGYDVTCRRMDTETGQWDSFPVSGY